MPAAGCWLGVPPYPLSTAFSSARKLGIGTLLVGNACACSAAIRIAAEHVAHVLVRLVCICLFPHLRWQAKLAPSARLPHLCGCHSAHQNQQRACCPLFCCFGVLLSAAFLLISCSAQNWAAAGMTFFMIASAPLWLLIRYALAGWPL